MTGDESGQPLRWRDAERAAGKLTPNGRRTLLLLTRLPLLAADALEALNGLSGAASVYRILARLEREGLVAAITPSIRPAGRARRLHYLTDLGLATVAIDQGRDLGALVRRGRLARRDLLALAPGIRQLVATYDLLAALARSQPGQPNLVAWERPWARRYLRPTAKAPVRLELPACAALSWDGGAGGEYLLISDLGASPLRAYRSILVSLLSWRALRNGRCPTLVVATTGSGRAEAWEHLLEEVRAATQEARIAVALATWERLAEDLSSCTNVQPSSEIPLSQSAQQSRLPSLGPHPSARVLPRSVREPLESTDPLDGELERQGRLALRLTPADRELLDLVGRHPYLSAAESSMILGWQPERTRARRNALVQEGLLRFVGPQEVGKTEARRGLVELTPLGLELVAAQQGLSVAAAVRHNGLVAGGPAGEIGSRHSLIKHFAHTVGVNAIFVGLCRVARRRAETGGDDALAEWRNAACCSRGALRPDGYGTYHRDGKLHGFFLEYDRGTLKARDYAEKLSAYYAYRDSGRFERDYLGFPTVLVVATDKRAEKRVVRAVMAAAVGRALALRVLVTCQWRLSSDPNKSSGFLGPIWREPESTGRHCWPS